MKKRSHGEGTFRKLPSGKWFGQIMVGYTPEGKRKIKSFTAPTKTEVQQKIRNYVESLASEEESKKNITFSEWADTWYADHRTQVEKSTYWNYSFTLKKLKDYFLNRPLAEIKQMDINRFIDTLLDSGFSKSTIGKCKAMLVQIFAAAEDNDLIKKNPALRAKAVKADKSQPHSEKNAYTPAQIETLMEFLPNDLMGNSILLLNGTGMRVQELLALTKDDISSDGSVINVNKAVKMAYREPILGTTKSKKSVRQIPVPKEYRKYALYLRAHSGKKFIWTSSRESGLYTIEEFRNRYKSTMKKVPGIPYYPPHCCRHTYITMLQAHLVPMDLISELAGHEEVSTTLGYTHVSLDTLKGVIDTLDN